MTLRVDEEIDLVHNAVYFIQKEEIIAWKIETNFFSMKVNIYYSTFVS